MRNTLKPTSASNQGSALVMALVFSSLTLIILGAIMQWTSTSTTLNQRNNQYFRTVAAAEAATEKVLGHIAEDYQNNGEAQVMRNLANYGREVPTPAENAAWADYAFTDVDGTPDRTHVEFIKSGVYRVLSSRYRGLRGWAHSFRLTANARELNGPLFIKAAVQQDLEVASIPLFQFAIFYNVDLEINPAPPMVVTGPVHCNDDIYLHPCESLAFRSDVTAAGQIIHDKKPEDPLDRTKGAIIFAPHPVRNTGGENRLNLPIGTNNSPKAVRQVVEIPPLLESPLSPLGQERLYNKADIIIQVTDDGMIGKSGLFNNFSTAFLPADLAQFVDTTKSFTDQRENKIVRAIEIDIARLRQWNQDTALLRLILSSGDIQTIYIADQRRHPAGYQSGIRLINGQTLPSKGLTVVTPNPLYVLGHYNAPAADLGTANTAATAPAALMGDAITILSGNWNDAESDKNPQTRKAADTTVNAAFLGGIVQTIPASYSGGVENFPRFLEDWDKKTFTYNGSMVVLFESEMATGSWGGDYYSPPNRNWAFDKNFEEVTKLPPSTPCARALIRGKWSVVAAR